jgi:hypothetical protein
MPLINEAERAASLNTFTIIFSRRVYGFYD